MGSLLRFRHATDLFYLFWVSWLRSFHELSVGQEHVFLASSLLFQGHPYPKSEEVVVRGGYRARHLYQVEPSHREETMLPNVSQGFRARGAIFFIWGNSVPDRNIVQTFDVLYVYLLALLLFVS